MTYGSIVRQLITDLDDVDLVNKQLDIMCGCLKGVTAVECLAFAHSLASHDAHVRLPVNAYLSEGYKLIGATILASG